jgi:hypothetical protein
MGHVEEIDTFTASDFNWLEKLGKLSKDFPPAQKVILSSLAITVRNEGDGQAAIEGRAADSGTISQIETLLSDAERQVTGRGGQFDPTQSSYPWRFQKTIILPPIDATDAATEAP